MIDDQVALQQEGADVAADECFAADLEGRHQVIQPAPLIRRKHVVGKAVPVPYGTGIEGGKADAGAVSHFHGSAVSGCLSHESLRPMLRLCLAGSG